MQNKKGFTLIELMIVVAIVAILAMIAVPMYQKYIERSRNTAAQNLLQQVALAEVASQVDAAGKVGTANSISYVYIAGVADTANVEILMKYGFRPDPNVGFVVLQPNPDDGFVAFACHVALKSQMYVYDNVAGGGVQQVTEAKYAGANTPTTTGLAVFYLDTGASVAKLKAPHKTLKIGGDYKSTGF